MVYKLGNIRDTAFLPLMDEEMKNIIYQQVRILSSEYGEYRDTDKDDGGYVLYVEQGTPTDAIKAIFDYSKSVPEQVDVIPTSKGKIYSALYLLNNEYSVTVIMSEADVPSEILKEV